MVTNPPQRRSQAERSAATRSALIGAAIRCAAVQGVGAVSAADVAREAGLTRGAVQHHFEGIREVWLAVAERAWQASLAAYLDAPTVDAPLEVRIPGWVAASRAAYQTELGRIAVEVFIVHRADRDFVEKARPAMVAAEGQLDRQWCAAVADVIPDEAKARWLRGVIRENSLGAYVRGIIAPERDAGAGDIAELVLSLIRLQMVKEAAP